MARTAQDVKEVAAITTRPQGVAKRLTLSEKLLIKAEHNTGKSKADVARKYSVAESTVARLWKDDKLGTMKQELALIKESMADDLYLTAHRSVKQVNDKLDETTASQAAVITGIMLDKARLLEGKSTQNHSLQGYIAVCNTTPV
jgi:hypothetical protein